RSPILESWGMGPFPETRHPASLSEQVGRMGPVRILLLAAFLDDRRRHHTEVTKRQEALGLPASHSDKRRLVKYASVPTPIHNATVPLLSPSLRSFTISTGCEAPCTYSRAFTPLTSTLIFVHSPGTRSTYDSYSPVPPCAAGSTRSPGRRFTAPSDCAATGRQRGRWWGGDRSIHISMCRGIHGTPRPRTRGHRRALRLRACRRLPSR